MLVLLVQEALLSNLAYYNLHNFVDVALFSKKISRPLVTTTHSTEI